MLERHQKPPCHSRESGNPVRSSAFMYHFSKVIEKKTISLDSRFRGNDASAYGLLSRGLLTPLTMHLPEQHISCVL